MSNPPPPPLATPMPWDLVSAAYTAEIVPMFELYARDALRLAAPPPGARIVDVACGPGTLALLAAQAGHPVDALDFSPAMISALEGRKRALGITAVTAQVGDGQALPFADATFGAAFSMFGLMFFPDRAKGFRELRRVLVPGARAVVSTWVRMEENPVMAAMFSALRTTMNEVLGPKAPQPGSQEMPLTTEEACRAEMSEAFADVEVHRIAHAQTYSSPAEIWASIERTMAPMVMMRKQLGDERWAPLSSAARDAIVAAIGSGPPVLTLPAWLSVGVAR
jgi:ubiquinone/menaquinone biosynthesis C-methylase UbiE